MQLIRLQRRREIFRILDIRPNAPFRHTPAHAKYLRHVGFQPAGDGRTYRLPLI